MSTTPTRRFDTDLPDAKGYFGPYGGQLVPPVLKQVMDDIDAAYETIRQRADFQEELAALLADYVGRPSPIFHARRLSKQLGGAQIHLKREDLNHTGAHKINHCLGEALLARFMGKKKVIAETGAGQHGVALATACALVGIPCEIHMGQVDIEKEHPNVTKMRILGCRLVPSSLWEHRYWSILCFQAQYYWRIWCLLQGFRQVFLGYPGV